ncbi:DUF551 domain-containing protein [Enterobacter hormaechei subsp. steigerwaltii]|nr:DUF551 domain-containing protein [Enterobacter hormaechei subsp. steigerwaltii]
MSALTKQWLQKTIAELEEERDATPGSVNEDAANALAAMKLALASLEAESVAFRSKLKPPSSIGSEHWDYTDHRQPDAFELESCVIERLHTAPPATVLMKDHQIRELVNELRDISFEYHGTQQLREHIARTIRAAMLQVAEPVSNRDELPDGWVACSERMPLNGERDIWLFDGKFVHHGYIWNGCDFVDLNEEYESIKGITHWMKMTLPAAPQKEVMP